MTMMMMKKNTLTTKSIFLDSITLLLLGSSTFGHVTASTARSAVAAVPTFGVGLRNDEDRPRQHHRTRIPLRRRVSHRHDVDDVEKSTLKSKALLDVRGGDLGSVKGETLATILCVFGGLDAISGLLAPYTSIKWLGLKFSSSGKDLYTKLSHHYMHGIGISSLCLIVSLMLTVHDVVPLEQALGYSLLVRLVSTLYLLVSGDSYELGMSDNVFVVLALLLGITSFHLLGGTGFVDVLGEVLGRFGGDQAAMNMVKIVSYLLAIHGYFLFSAPKLFVQRAVRRKEKQEQQSSKQGGTNKKRKNSDDAQADLQYKLTTNLASLNGGYIAMSSAVMYLLAHGLDPVEIAGMTAIGFIPILQKAIKTIDVSIKANGGGGKGRFFGIIPIDSKSVWGGGMLISVMLGTIGAGCLSTTFAPTASINPLGAPTVASAPSAPSIPQEPVSIPDGPPTPPIE
eukprot:CAMPEP_0113456830 /NCGR_PEP_ID=MMETSP0014_2-20120614/9091_1 /TAXON_ID=2857 /ORGANISM="Nitzschia sp." /LENGTH=453 /DNA_ID=CAMNT_0000348299 /DNA_START=9 /DNA_END=1370 /DNA_ORIENTATION=+ /assembly_acc=CAM_ASM_000159